MDEKITRIQILGGSGTGKTTLLNALLGSGILPVLPQNAAVPGIFTCVGYNMAESVKIWFMPTEASGRPPVCRAMLEHLQTKGLETMTASRQQLPELMAYPPAPAGTRWGITPVSQIRVNLTDPRLKGLELGDAQGLLTPSMNRYRVIRGVKEADEILFVTAARAPLTPDEQWFLRELVLAHGKKEIHVAVNCCDLLSESQIAVCREVTEQRLRQMGFVPQIYCVSALAALRGQDGGDLQRLKDRFLAKEQPQTQEQPQVAAARLPVKKEVTPMVLPDIGEETQEQAAKLSDEDFFSSDNLDELTGIEDYAAFAETMLERYPWPGEQRQDFDRRLQRIRSRKNQQKLNVSVIGEFSTGKSTFINALLRGNLLQTGSVQGTTVVSTVIEYGKDFVLAARNRDGSQSLLRFDSFQELRSKLTELVSENPQGESLHCVRVTLPSQALKASGMRIIDTPGTDAVTAWHEEATVQTLQQLSDLSILLVNATRPMTESFCGFLRENFTQRELERCVFVVTKLDMIPEAERPKMLTYIRMKIVQALEVEHPVVLPYFSAEVAGTFSRSEFATGDQKALQISKKSELYIRKHTARQRSLLQMEYMLDLIDAMYQAVSEQIPKVSEQWEEELALLEQSRHAALSDSIRQLVKAPMEGYDAATLGQSRHLEQHLASVRGQILNALLQRLEQLGSITALDDYVNQALPGLCESQGRRLMEHIWELSSNFPKYRVQQLGRFRRDFMELYEQLQILPVPPEELEAPANLPEAMELPALPDAQAYLAAMANDTAKAGLFGSELQAKRKSYRSRLTPVLNAYLDEVVRRSRQRYDSFAAQVRRNLLETMENYGPAYCEYLEQQAAEGKNRRSGMEQKLSRIQLDMEDISNRRFMLDSMRNSLARTE